jgi:hypothetical protein
VDLAKEGLDGRGDDEEGSVGSGEEWSRGSAKEFFFFF